MSDKERTAPSGSKDSVKPIQGVDIGSDGKENESDRKIREFTLAELEKSKKILPKERYEALVKAVGEILRGHYEKEEEVREGVRAKIAEFKGEVGIGNSIDENESCIRNKFDVADINGVKTAVFLKSVFSDPKKLQEFRVLLEKDTDLLAGFIRYWSMQNIDGAITDKSNLKRIMLWRNDAAITETIDTFYKNLLETKGLKLEVTDVNAFASKNASDEEKTGEIAEKLGKVRIYEKKEAKGKLHSSEESRENFDKLISGGRSLGDYDNKDISHVISYAYANAHKEIPLSNESVRDLGAMAKLKDKLARDPRGLLAISKGWGITATTEPRLDLNLQVKAAGIKIELISNIKESFILATDKKIGDFAQSQLGEKADPEAVSALTTKLKDAISRPEANSEYFGNVCREVDKALRKAGIKKPSSEDNLHFIRQVLELKAGETRFNASTNEFSAKAFQAFGKAENAAQVEKIRKSLLEKAVTEEDKKAVNEAADDRIRALPVEAIAKSFGSAYETPKISEPGAIAIETKANKGEITADGIRKDLARNIESHKALSGAATALQSAGLLNGKHISELSAHEITKTAKELKEKPNPSEAEKKTIGEMEKYEGTVLEAKRETVAIVRGISYDEVRQLEKRGETVESMYEKARAEPIFKTADKISVGEIPDRISYENFSSERMERMRTGQTVSMDLGSETTNVIIAKTGDSVAPYRISVGGMEAYSCNEKNLVSHLEMAKLLCENGLEFLAPVSADMLRIASVREGNLATAKDGEFTDREKRALLKTFADTFGIEGFPKSAVETRQMETYLKTYATERGASLQELGIRSKILDESGNIANKEGFLRRLG